MSYKNSHMCQIDLSIGSESDSFDEYPIYKVTLFNIVLQGYFKVDI